MFMNEKVPILIVISLNLVLKDSIDKLVFVQVMAWHQAIDKP